MENKTQKVCDNSQYQLCKKFFKFLFLNLFILANLLLSKNKDCKCKKFIFITQFADLENEDNIMKKRENFAV